MEEKYFVNEGFNYAINEYLESKKDVESIKFNSFLVVIFRLLTLIYDELDLLNPYYFNNEENLYINMNKYGYLRSNLNKFFIMIDRFYHNQGEEEFVSLQKMIVDMYIAKKMNMSVSLEDENKIRTLLYSPYSEHPLLVSYNFLMTSNPNEVINYFDEEVKNHIRKKEEKPKETLNLEAYEILKYSLTDIQNMDSDSLDEVNKKVYDYFKINENAINKKYLLDKAVYDFNNPKPAFSTGNGYVDILFFLSLTATIGLIVFLITLLIV